NDDTVVSRVQLDTLDRDATPVAVIAAGQRGLRVVYGGLNRPGDQRTHAVGTDDYVSLLSTDRTAWGVAADTCDAIAVHEHLLHGEALSQLDTGLNGGIDEDRIEHGTPRAVGLSDAIGRWGRAGEGEKAKVHGGLRNGRAVRGNDLVQQPPALEP